MSKVVLISVATSVGLGLLSVHLVKQLKEGEATIADLKAQVTTLQEQQQQAPPPAPLPIVEQPIEQPAVAAVAAPVKEAPKFAAVATAGGQLMPMGAPTREERMRMFREHRERQRQLLQDPEYREALRLQTRGSVSRQYPGVIQELGLDPQQAEEFFDLLTDQQMRTNDQMQPIWEMASGDPNDQAAVQERHRNFAKQAEENQRKSEAEIAARLGPDKLQAWKEYQSTMGVRFELESMRNSLSASGLPLSEDMSKPMLKALAQASQLDASEMAAAMNRGAGPAAGRLAVNTFADGSANMERQLEYTKRRNQRMLDAISPYLSFEQRAAIEKQQEAQLKMQEAQLRVMRAQRKAENNGVYAEESVVLMPLQP